MWSDRLASQLPPSSSPLLRPFRPIKLATTTNTSRWPIFPTKKEIFKIIK